MISPEDKEYWCEKGAEDEVAFAGPLIGSGCAVFMNPAKQENPYTHDTFIVMPSDVKTIRTRFNTSDRYGIPSFSAFTLNVKDIVRYQNKYPNIVIVFDIDYGDFKTTRYAALRDITRAIKSGHAKLHTYLHRVDDTSGNAKESYILDAMWFPELKR